MCGLFFFFQEQEGVYDSVVSRVQTRVLSLLLLGHLSNLLRNGTLHGEIQKIEGVVVSLNELCSANVDELNT